MTIEQIRAAVKAAGGTIKPAINWEWAIFADDNVGRRVFEQVHMHCEHRGYYLAQPDSDNPNLRQGGFRFRS